MRHEDGRPSELGLGLKMAVVALVAAVITAGGVIGAGRALMPGGSTALAVSNDLIPVSTR